MALLGRGGLWLPSGSRVALLRALTEAAQARLTVISGLRDDFRRDAYDQVLDPDVIRAVRHRMTRPAQTRHFRDVPNWEGETLEDDVEWELECSYEGRQSDKS